MAKKSEAEVLLGFKRICPACNTRYYDMAKMPPTCPNCATEYNPEALLKSRRNRPIEDEEELKIKPRKTAAANEDGEEEVAEGEEEYEELDGEAELTPDEDTVDVEVDADEDDEDVDDDVLEDTSDLGDDDALVDVEIEKEEEI